MATPIVIHNESGYIRAGLTSGDEPSFVFRTDSITGKSPLKKDIVQDWEGMKQVWLAVFDKLGVDPCQHPVLLTEPPLNPKHDREKATTMFFETFGVPGFYLTTSGVMGLYGAGKTTGAILEIGEDVTHTLAIYEGYALPHTVSHMGFGKKDINNIEQFFQPQVIGYQSEGIADNMFVTIMKCDLDIRSDMYANMVITGSGSKFGGLVDRFTREMRALAPATMSIHVTQPEPCDQLIWKGGDILAPVLDQYGMWVTPQDYAAQGPTVIHRKCF